VLADTSTFAFFAGIAKKTMFACVASSAFYTVFLDSIMFLTATAYFFTELTGALPLIWMFLTESSSLAFFAGVVVLVWMIWTFFLTTGLAVVLDITVLTFDCWIAIRTLVLRTTLSMSMFLIMAEEVGRAGCTASL
jgi:hypothetical protein